MKKNQNLIQTQSHVHWWIVFLAGITGALILSLGGIYLCLASRECSEAASSKVLKCVQIDSRTKTIDQEKCYQEKDLIPVEARITADFRFSGESILFYNSFPGENNFANREGYATTTGARVPILVYPDQENVYFFVDKLSLPHIFSPYPASVWEDDGVAPPLYNEFLYDDSLETINSNNRFYFLSGASCTYGQRICYQKLIRMNNTGGEIQEIEIPSDYSPEIKTWEGGEEGGISNINTYLKEIVHVDDQKIVFKTDDLNATQETKYVALNVTDNSWEEIQNTEDLSAVKNPSSLLDSNDCVSYKTSQGDFVVKKDQGVESGKESIGVYFLKSE